MKMTKYLKKHEYTFAYRMSGKGNEILATKDYPTRLEVAHTKEGAPYLDFDFADEAEFHTIKLGKNDELDIPESILVPVMCL